MFFVQLDSLDNQDQCIVFVRRPRLRTDLGDKFPTTQTSGVMGTVVLKKIEREKRNHQRGGIYTRSNLRRHLTSLADLLHGFL